MAYYLIDFENVKSPGLNGITKLTDKDTVCIFYSENSDSITFGLHKRLNETAANLLYQKVEVGTKNALDFQLSSYLGYIICENENNKNIPYYVVTKDKGFGCLSTYWARRGFHVSLVADVGGRDEQAEADELTKKVEQVLADKDPAAVPMVVKFIQQYKTKQGINNALAKNYKDNKKAAEIYSAIKPLIKDKKGN